MFNHADREVPGPSPRIAAVSCGRSGTIQGRIVAQSPDGSVTLLTPQGWVTGRPVAPEATRPKGFVASFFRR